MAVRQPGSFLMPGCHGVYVTRHDCQKHALPFFGSDLRDWQSDRALDQMAAIRAKHHLFSRRSRSLPLFHGPFLLVRNSGLTLSLVVLQYASLPYSSCPRRPVLRSSCVRIPPRCARHHRRMREPRRGARSPGPTRDIDCRWRGWCVDLYSSQCFILLSLSPSADACLCVSGVPLFVETNVVGILAATIAGKPVVTQILTQLVR